MNSETQAIAVAVEVAVPDHAHPNQFALLRQRRFASFFWTQSSGAANDNVFKFAFTVMVTYQLNVGWLPPAMAGLVIGALFILPFLLFSATSGQLTDKFDKTAMIRFVKNLEMAIMLLGCTFLMGLHSTLFGPLKFVYLPQVLSERELTGGNGMVEMGTFVAILLGNIAGGLLGISWMWFFGAVFLSQFPCLAKEVQHGNEQVASALLVVFSIGIGTGSLL